LQLISAVVRPLKVDDVCNALQASGFHGFTVINASGFGKVRGHGEFYRGVEHSSEFQNHAKLEIVAADEDVAGIIDVICTIAATGGLGDGKIWVTPVDLLVRIRTREIGTEAL
jgi:nitrogen regulatory protein P-II 1